MNIIQEKFVTRKYVKKAREFAVKGEYAMSSMYLTHIYQIIANEELDVKAIAKLGKIVKRFPLGDVAKGDILLQAISLVKYQIQKEKAD